MIFNTSLLQRAKKEGVTHGIHAGIFSFFHELGVDSLSHTGEIPATGPVLVISNHLGPFDNLLLLSQISRNDFYFTALSTYYIFGSLVQEKLLPIYRIRTLNHQIYEYPLCLEMSGKPPEPLSVSEVKERNRETISKAAARINEGHAVSIFPTGSAGKSLSGSTWKAGVGFIVKQITNKNTNVVFAHIQGTRGTDLVAYLHPIIRRLFFKPQPISIIFSKPRKLFDIVDGDQDGKAVTRQLENLYSQYTKEPKE